MKICAFCSTTIPNEFWLTVKIGGGGFCYFCCLDCFKKSEIAWGNLGDHTDSV
jgi:hypothetical protein